MLSLNCPNLWGRGVGGRSRQASRMPKFPGSNPAAGPDFNIRKKRFLNFSFRWIFVFRISFVKNYFSKFRLKSFFGIQRSPKTIYSIVKNLMLPLAAYSLTDPEVGEPAK